MEHRASGQGSMSGTVSNNGGSVGSCCTKAMNFISLAMGDLNEL